MLATFVDRVFDRARPHSPSSTPVGRDVAPWRSWQVRVCHVPRPTTWRGSRSAARSRVIAP